MSKEQKRNRFHAKELPVETESTDFEKVMGGPWAVGHGPHMANKRPAIVDTPNLASSIMSTTKSDY